MTDASAGTIEVNLPCGTLLRTEETRELRDKWEAAMVAVLSGVLRERYPFHVVRVKFTEQAMRPLVRVEFFDDVGASTKERVRDAISLLVSEAVKSEVLRMLGDAPRKPR